MTFTPEWLNFGHIVSADVIEADPKKETTIKNRSTPTTVSEVHSFLGFTNHYRWFIYRYAHITHPLNPLTVGENICKKRQKVERTDECKESFRKLKELCSSTPVLVYTNYSKPFKLHTNACGLGLGAVLYQKQDDDTDRVTAYAGWTCSKSERNYLAHKLEFLVLKWAITNRFHK